VSLLEWTSLERPSAEHLIHDGEKGVDLVARFGITAFNLLGRGQREDGVTSIGVAGLVPRQVRVDDRVDQVGKLGAVVGDRVSAVFAEDQA
jgi:hypothetical protein